MHGKDWDVIVLSIAVPLDLLSGDAMKNECIFGMFDCLNGEDSAVCYSHQHPQDRCSLVTMPFVRCSVGVVKPLQADRPSNPVLECPLRALATGPKNSPSRR